MTNQARDRRVSVAHRFFKLGIDRRGFDSERLSLNNFQMAVLSLKLGQKKQSIDFLIKARERMELGLPYLNAEPLLDSLRDDPGFKDLIIQMRFPTKTELGSVPKY